MRKYYIGVAFMAIILFFSKCSREKIFQLEQQTKGELGEKIFKAELGRKIFFDNHLSNPIGQSCSSCHSPETAFSDPNHSITSPGAVKGLFGNRNSPALTYALYIPPLHYNAEDETYEGGLFWDGRVNSLEEQAKKPFFNPIEMNLKDNTVLAQKIRTASYYGEYKRIYGDHNDAADIVLNNVADALATFERTPVFNLFTSKYDYFLKGMAKLTDEENKGLILFTTKAKCSNCHLTDPDEASGKILFTDFTYDNIGIPANPNNKFYTLPTAFNPDGRGFKDEGLGVTVNDLPVNGGQFKVPTLRNIAVSAPYFHNGAFNTLEQVVHFYNKRDADGVKPEIVGNVNDEELGELHLTPKEEKQVVAFLKTLTDGYR